MPTPVQIKAAADLLDYPKTLSYLNQLSKTDYDAYFAYLAANK